MHLCFLLCVFKVTVLNNSVMVEISPSLSAAFLLSLLTVLLSDLNLGCFHHFVY